MKRKTYLQWFMYHFIAPRCPVNWKAGALLGSGAFGEVYVCHDKDTGRDLAMKVVRLEQMNAETSKVHLKQNAFFFVS